MKIIKKNRIFLVTMFTVAVLSSGCEDFLDVTPDNIATIDYAFRLRATAETFLFTCYSYMPSHAATGGNPALFGADECWLVPTSGNTSFHIARGNQRVVNPYMNAWQGANGCKDIYQGIRDCNVFLENIDVVPDMMQSEKDRWSAEVKFLKAYYHFYLIRMYGPIVLIKENLPVDASPDEVKIPRSPVNECFDYVVTLLDEAYLDLPDKISNEVQESGRITQAICLSLKAKTLITAASDLFSGNPDYKGFTNKDGTPLFDTEIGEEEKLAKWQKAAEACKEAIDFCHGIGHKLYYYRPAFSSTPLTDSTMTQMNIRNAFCEKWNSEVIWANTNSIASGIQASSTPRGLDGTSNSGAQGSMAPPLKIIEMFYSDNGVPIQEDDEWDYNSRFNIMEPKESEAVYLKQGYLTAKMNFHREPRYYADLGFDGGIWYGQGHYDDRGSDLLFVSCKRGQPAAAINLASYSTTGYWTKKLVHFQSVLGSGNTYTTENYPWPVIRLADLYLLYAEALNEVADSETNRAEALQYVDMIRERAGLQSVRVSWLNYSNNPRKPETQPGLREIIRRERTIELAFEGQRFWDLRRWKAAVDELNTPITGWDLDQETAEGYYRERLVYEQSFTTRVYLWTIIENFILENSNLVQNPGWYKTENMINIKKNDKTDMKKIFLLYMKTCLIMSLLIITAVSCTDLERGIPANDRTVPLQAEQIEVTSIPGGATLTYQLPPNSNVLYVMAEYTLADGVLHNKKSSYFGNSITLEGFSDTNPYDVDIYSVSRSGVKSEPVRKTIVPLLPPYRTASNSLKAEPTFGGAKFFFENPSGANLKFVVVTTDSVGKYYQAYTHYTKIEAGTFAIRGFDTQQRVFGIYTLDRWNNRSDTVFKEIEPWFEEELDKTRFVNAKLPSDVYEPHMSASYSLEAIWNDIWGTGGAFHSKPNTGIPQWFTIDLRQKTRLSRMKFYHRTSAGSDGQYNAGDPQIFEIYGSNTLSDEWDANWTLLGHFESIKPSGAAGFTDEDVQYACHEGEDFDFTNNDPFRYIRFKTLKTWGGLTYIYIAELTFWGEILERY